jgi:hypothetical protein
LIEKQNKRRNKMSEGSNESSSERSERIHNEGQEDGAKPWGSYDRPHGAVSTLVSDTESKCKDNADYDAGFHNAREQRPR